jgi:D-beta-D-heptose 7-phosphate kinase/D-beta-D-heptose 1-phosphate adenosyltransferase
MTLGIKHLEHLRQRRILVVGDAMLDRYTWGDAERVSPEAPVVVLRAAEREVRLGGSASVAQLLRVAFASSTASTVSPLPPSSVE